MKTRDIVFYATLAVAALAMAGCEKSNDMPQESGPGHPAEIRFAPAIVPLTRATGTAFEEGDAVGASGRPTTRPQPLSANGILTTNSSR